MKETTKEKYPELYKINKHIVSVYKERDYWKEKYIFLKDEFDIYKIEKTLLYLYHPIYKKLLYLDPCVSNESEFYRSYLEEFHLKNRKF